MSKSNLIFLAACGAAWLLLYQLIGIQNRPLVVEEHPRSGGNPLTRIRPAGQLKQTLPVRVLLIHGLSASKSAMKQMAAELARWGSDCYLIDLPGHGDSPQRFSFESAVRATDEAIQELISRSNGTDSASPPLVVIGHSFGARMAMKAAHRHPGIAGVIALSPAAEPFAPKTKVPVLIVIGEFDFPFVRRGAAFLYEQVSGIRLPRLDEPGQWQVPSGSSRLVVLPWTDHSQTLFRASSLQEIKKSLATVSPRIAEFPFSERAFWLRTQLRAMFCILSLLIWFPATAFLVDLVMREREKPRINPFIGCSNGPYTLLRVYASGSALTTLFLLWMNPWERLRLMGGDYMAGFLCGTGLWGLAVLRPAWKSASRERLALLCSFLAWLVLVVGCSPWVTAEFVHVDLTAVRLWRFPWISLSVLPFFILDEQVCRRMLYGLSMARALMFHLSTRFILAISLLLGFFVLRNGQFLLVLILPGLLLVSLLCWCLTAWIHRKTGSIAASGFFGALATGWFFSVFFAQH